MAFNQFMNINILQITEITGQGKKEGVSKKDCKCMSAHRHNIFFNMCIYFFFLELLEVVERNENILSNEK